LIGKGDFHELNRVAASLLVEQQRVEAQPIPPTMNEETRQKGKLTLLERMEKTVVKGAEKFKKIGYGRG
jgi:hypothetical protein